MDKLKKRVFDIIQPSYSNDFASKAFDFFIIILIVINIVLVLIDTFDIPYIWIQIFYFVELISVTIFTIEYLLRLWTADFLYPNMKPYAARIKHIFSFMSIIDLLAILPFYLPFLIPIDLRVLKTLRVFRLLRLLKVNRYTNALVSIANVFNKKVHQLLSSLFVVFILIILSSVLMYNVESVAQPEVFDNAFSGMWWSIATLTTVGYGDIYPITVIGKILSSIISLLGIGLVAVPIGIISAGFIENIENENKQISTSSTEKSSADELMKFKQLLDAGVITASEFEETKTKILSLIK